MSDSKAASSIAFKFVERFSVKAIGLVIGIILARILEPELFGLLAIITVFVNLAQSFVQSGLGIALVQSRTIEKDDYSTVFFISLGMAAFFVIILYCLAPLIADYYESNQLTWPLRVFSLSLFFCALNSVQTAKLQREMRFDIMMRCNLIATIISGTIGVILAFLGANLWALVWYNVSQVLIVTVCMLIADKWYPSFVFSTKRAKELFGFGWKMLVSGVLCSLYNDIRSLIIGKKYSTTDLAYYNKGQQFPDVLANTIDVSIQSVMLPIMSREQDCIPKLNDMLLKTIEISMFAIAPIMLGLASTAETLIPLLLTEKWNASIPIMCVFCISYLTYPIMTTNLSLLKAIGRSDIYMKTEITRRVVMLAVLLVTVFAFNSVMAIVIGYMISALIDILIIVCVTRRLTGIGFIEQCLCVWKTIVAGLIMTICVYVINLFPIYAIIRLILQIIVGVAIYIFVSLLLKNNALNVLLKYLREFLKGKKA